MTLRVSLLLCALTWGTCLAAAERPNIIFILSDDLGLPALGCTGGVYKTPNLDALAQGGIRFENCFAAPLCGPSRALLMTGRYAFRTGVRDNGLGAQATPEKDGCVALRMKQAGYATAVAGKWRQLSHFTTKEDAARWGFDEFLIWGAGVPDEDETGAKAKKKPAGNAAAKNDRYWDPDYNLNGKPLKDAEGKYGPDVLNEFVIDFVRRHQQQPFFVYYPTPLIHGPILPTPDSQQKDGKKQRAKQVDNVGSGSHYADNIEYLDKLIGKLVAELDALKLREKTLIVFTGDNGSVPVGTVHGRPVDGKKSNVLEGGSRVPLIANWPAATPAGAVSKDLVDFSDMLPTFAELAGVKPAEGRVIDGRSFAPQLRGEKGQPREWAYVHLGERRYVRSDRWKLTGEGELFDMSDAPHRQIPVAADRSDSDAVAARAKLQKALDGLLAEEAKHDPPASKRKAKKNKAAGSTNAAEKLNALVIDGQNNHSWKATTPVLKKHLEDTGRFVVDVATSPAKGEDQSAFNPMFSQYDVVVSNYNGDLWNSRMQQALVEYVRGGGGLVIVHAANNAFQSWPEYNAMIGLGWRDANFGDRLTLNDQGQPVRTPKGEGPKSGHGPQHAFKVVVRDQDHPITRGLPPEWMHASDELYHGQRGPAQNMRVLATAWSAPEQKGTSAHEPMLWVIPYGQGRVFTTVLGHSPEAMQCVGFMVTFQRGAEWAATDKVTLTQLPNDFPSSTEVSARK